MAAGPNPTASVTVAPPLDGSVTGGSIFEEFELKTMRNVLSAVCEKFRFHPESDDGRRASLAIVRHAAGGTSDPVQLARAVEADLIAERQTSDD